MSARISPEETFAAYMSGDQGLMLRERRFMHLLPSSPRCKTCNAPFGAPGSWFARAIGRGRWEKNPRFCKHCYKFLRSTGIRGAEVDISLLFADVRDSTRLAETLGNAAFSRLIQGFYRTATRILVESDAVIDKFVGDGVIALFVPAMSGMDHPSKAIQAGRQLLRAVGAASADGPGLPLGAGVHSGVAFIGVVGDGMEAVDFTALGDAVNVTARLATAAAAGELLVTEGSASRAGLDIAPLPRRRLELKGRATPVDVVVLAPS
jgi:adenylate cyclase